MLIRERNWLNCESAECTPVFAMQHVKWALMTAYKVNNAVFRRIGDERLLVPVEGRLADMQNVFTLNESSAFIWEQIQAGMDSTAICEQMVRHYDIPAEQAKKDYESFITTLLAEGLITEESS